MDKDIAKTFGRFDNGFTLTFENGLVLSTRFGPGNYCDNHEMDISSHMDNLFSNTVEVGVWDSDSREPRNWVNGWQEAVFDDVREVVFDVVDPYDDVRGYVTMPEWLQILEWCRAWKPE